MTTDTVLVDTDLLDECIDRIDDAETLLAALIELRERLSAGVVDFEAHTDIAADIRDTTDRLHSFGLGIR